MFRTHSIITAVSFAAIIFGVTNGALAASIDVGAVLDSKQALSLSNVQSMNFGHIDFVTVHSGTIQLATNGAVSFLNGVGLVASGAPSAGSVDIGSDGISAMEVSCETGGVLADTAANTLTLANTEIVAGVGVALGNGTACAGIGTTPLVVTGATIIRIGGSIDVAGNALHTGVYSSVNAGGDPVTIDVIYQ